MTCYNSSNADKEERITRFPLLASYVTIKLDPVMSVKNLEDDDATSAAHHATSKVYVGYLVNYGDWIDESDGEYANYLIHLLRSGLPKPSTDGLIEEYMCIPVFPNTDHPSREPLTPSGPLPIGWSHCYHAAFETASLRVPVRYGNNPIPIQLPLTEQAKHLTSISEDYKRSENLMQASQPVSLPSMTEFRSERAPSPVPSEDPDEFVASKQSLSSGGRSVSVASTDEDDTLKRVPPPIAAISYDLDAVSSLEDPQDLLAEIRYVETLYHEARARASAQRVQAKEELARAIKEAQMLDEATYNTFQSNLISVPQVNPSAAPESAPSSNGNPIRKIVSFLSKTRLSFPPAKSIKHMGEPPFNSEECVETQECHGGSVLQPACEDRNPQLTKPPPDQEAGVNVAGEKHYSSASSENIHDRALLAKDHSEAAMLPLSEGADVTVSGGEDGTALQLASKAGDVEFVKLLLDQGADVNVAGGRYGTALQAASAEGHLEIVRLLLKQGANVNDAGGPRGTALQGAIMKGQFEVARLLLDAGADVNIDGDGRGTVLQRTSEEGHLDIVGLLLDKGADVNAAGAYYGTPLYAASEEGHLEVVRLLLDKGANINAAGGYYGTALQAASAGDHLEVATLLRERGAVEFEEDSYSDY
ncbi:hypothetical protein HWV62_29682 [Athelia sp. TMB]|nr:hypothetical protein HWV62_29682 [Athelia sp. TMB]